MNNTTAVLIGCGGIGSWLAQALSRTLSVGENNRLVLVDRDLLEDKNLDRQLFTPRDIGKPKAVCMGESITRSLPRGSVVVTPTVRWWGEDPDRDRALVAEPNSVYLVCAVDNHPARVHALSVADEVEVPLINCANGTTVSAEARYYHPDWKGDKARDPRIRNPEILEDKSDDPLNPSCTEQAQSDPQIVTANMLAASYGMLLLHLWEEVAPTVDKKMRGTHIPFYIDNSMNTMTMEPALA